MKQWTCDACNCDIEVHGEYEPEHCCDGRMCGCMGTNINPVFCDACEKKIFSSGDEFKIQIEN